MRLPASGSWWSEQILDTVPNERFSARDLKESKSDRTHPAAFLCAKRSLQNVSRSGEKGWNDDKGLSSLAVSP